MSTVHQRDTDGHWVLTLNRYPIIEHIDLNRESSRSIGSGNEAERLARQWLVDVGVYRVRCPYCGAERGRKCSKRAVHMVAPNARPIAPHSARLKLVGL